MYIIKKIIKFCFVIIILCLPFFTANAAILYFDPDSNQYQSGDIFGVDIKIELETDEKCINTVEARLDFSSDILKVVDFSTGESILSLWISKPGTVDVEEINRKGQIYFAGGIPGGYCGKIPGDIGDSNIIGKIFFNVIGLVDNSKKTQSAEVYFLKDTKVFLNDGLGTVAKTVLKKAEFNIVNKIGIPKDELKELIDKDNIPPKSFVIEFNQDSAIFDGQYFIIFSTSDKETGIDHYEILEINNDKLQDKKFKRNFFNILFNKKDEPLKWKLASSPYLLKDQSLQSIIKVKAIDKAGNERIIEYAPHTSIQKKTKWYSQQNLFMLLLIIVVLLILLGLLFLFKKIRSNKKNEEEKF